MRCPRKRPLFFSCLFLLLLLPFLTPHIESARVGKADLILQHLNPSLDGAPPKVGDILNLALKIDAQNETITGVVVYLTLDDDYFEIIPAFQNQFSMRPFRQGDWLVGRLYQNGALGDSLTNSFANKLPNFQLVYSEDRSPNGLQLGRQGVSGKGILAELSVRLIKDHQNPLEAITVDHISPTGSESGYFNQRFPGIVYSLNVIRETSPPGDFNNDNTRDFNDFLMFIQSYGQTSTDRTYSARYDLDGNQEIGFGDFLIFTQVFGK